MDSMDRLGGYCFAPGFNIPNHSLFPGVLLARLVAALKEKGGGALNIL